MIKLIISLIYNMLVENIHFDIIPPVKTEMYKWFHRIWDGLIFILNVKIECCFFFIVNTVFHFESYPFI